MIPIPSVRPDPSWPLLRARLEAAGHSVAKVLQQKLVVCAVRGLFSNTIGKPGNDLNAYDDGGYVLLPFGKEEPMVRTFNFNTDPTRLGWNANAGKYMARLKVGWWTMQRRMHRGRYWAFGQESTPVTVERVNASGVVEREETGLFGIDLHPGGKNSTSSEGCQTVPPEEQWQSLYHLITNTVGNAKFPYILMAA